MSEPATHPAQATCCHGRGVVSTAVTMQAYEVYCHVYGPQKEMIEGSCRGGFSQGELIAFLYAHAFPRVEWKARVDEAFKGMKWSR